MSFTRSGRAGTIALAAAPVAAAACGASPRVEREVAARKAPALRVGATTDAGATRKVA
jgi:hypothetical protein